MKKNILTIGLSLLSIVAIAQKKEVRDAGKAIEKGSYAEAKTLLTQAESMLGDANDNLKQDFYVFKGQAYLGTGEGTSVKDLMTASDAFKKAEELGNAEAAAQGLAGVTNSLIQSAINDQNAEKYDMAAEKLYAGYKLNPKDTLYLYFAASNAVTAKDYDTALKYYEDLKDLGYTGIETEYLAVNKATGEEEAMPKAQRDLMVKSGEYIKPEDRVAPSKAGEITKNIALIYIEQGREDEAVTALEAAKSANPEDTSLMQTEADMYYKMGKKDKYKEIMEEIVAQDPTNGTLYYNLGVTAFEMGDNDGAISYYEKALEYKPEMTEARLNIAAAILSNEAKIVEEMNKLGMSKADTKKYDELAENRKEVYRKALPYLETVMENDADNLEAIRTSMNIYYQLGENEKADALQAKLTAKENK